MKSYEELLLSKILILFRNVKDKIKENITFIEFVNNLDVNDKFNKRLFEFIVKEALQKSIKKKNNRKSNNDGEEVRSIIPFMSDDGLYDYLTWTPIE